MTDLVETAGLEPATPTCEAGTPDQLSYASTANYYSTPPSYCKRKFHKKLIDNG